MSAGDHISVTVPRLMLNVFGNTVSLVLITGGDYEAQVLFDDICERMKRGEKVNFGLSGMQYADEKEGQPHERG